MNASRIVRLLQRPYFVYCSQAWQQAAARIVRRIPITCPPVTSANFNPTWMEGKRLLVFKLHGYEGDPNWYGLGQSHEKPVALTPNLVLEADLTGTVIIAVVCHGASSAMQDAFFAAGARAFIGSAVEVRARETQPGEADNLARLLLTLLAKSPQDLPGAFAGAQELYRMTVPEWTEHDEWTLQTFNLFTPKKGEYHHG